MGAILMGNGGKKTNGEIGEIIYVPGYSKDYFRAVEAW